MLLLLLSNIGLAWGTVGAQQTITLFTVGTSTHKMVVSSSSQVHILKSSAMRVATGLQQNIHSVNSSINKIKVGVNKDEESV